MPSNHAVPIIHWKRSRRKSSSSSEPGSSESMKNNDTCDLCGYTHPRPDNDGIVVMFPDGIYRCKVCRLKLNQRVDRHYDDNLWEPDNEEDELW